MEKTALVTGGSHNIGQGIAVVLAEKGYDVAITYRNRPEGAEDTRRAVEALGRRCFVMHAELGEPDAPQQVVDWAYEVLGGLELVVCNAVNPGGEDVRRVLADNPFAPFAIPLGLGLVVAGGFERFLSFRRALGQPKVN